MNTPIKLSTGKASNDNGRITTNMSEIIRTRQDSNLKRSNSPKQAGNHVAASNRGENVPNTGNDEKTPANVSKNVG